MLAIACMFSTVSATINMSPKKTIGKTITNIFLQTHQARLMHELSI